MGLTIIHFAPFDSLTQNNCPLSSPFPRSPVRRKVGYSCAWVLVVVRISAVLAASISLCCGSLQP